MNDGFLFDNILLGHDLTAAKAFAEATSGAKLTEEKAEEEKEKEVAEEAESAGKVKNVVLQKVLEKARELSDLEALAAVKPYLTVRAETYYGVGKPWDLSTEIYLCLKGTLNPLTPSKCGANCNLRATF